MKTDKEIIEEVLSEMYPYMSMENDVVKAIQKALNLSKANYKKQVEDLIDKFDFKNYSLAVNPIQERNNIRQLKEELKQKLGEIK